MVRARMELQKHAIVVEAGIPVRSFVAFELGGVVFQSCSAFVRIVDSSGIDIGWGTLLHASCTI